MNDGVDVGRIAETAERLGLVSPDMQGPDEDLGEEDGIVVVIHINGGLLASAGTRRRDTGRVRIIVQDDDNYEAGDDAYTETPSALEDWALGPDGCLARCKSELPDDLIAELGIPDPTPRPNTNVD